MSLAKRGTRKISARKAWLELCFQRGFPLTDGNPSHGVHSVDMPDLARSMGLEVWNERAGSRTTSLVVSGSSVIVGRFAELFFAHVVDEAVPDRIGKKGLMYKDRARYAVVMSFLAPP